MNKRSQVILSFLLIVSMMVAAVPVHQIFHDHHFAVTVNHDGHDENDQHVQSYQKTCCQVASVSSKNAILGSYSQYDFTSYSIYLHPEAAQTLITQNQFSFKNKAPPVAIV